MLFSGLVSGNSSGAYADGEEEKEKEVEGVNPSFLSGFCFLASSGNYRGDGYDDDDYNCGRCDRQV